MPDPVPAEPGPIFILVGPVTGTETVVAATHPDGTPYTMAEALAAHWPRR